MARASAVAAFCHSGRRGAVRRVLVRQRQIHARGAVVDLAQLVRKRQQQVKQVLVIALQ